jgi:hypothetical protein
MKIKAIFFAVTCLLIAISTHTYAQADWNVIEKNNILSTDSIVKGKYTLLLINKDTGLDLKVKQRMIDAFFKVYPEEARAYNANTAKKVTFIIDPAYNGVAATGGNIVRYNPDWFHKHPEDIDVVTHEVMHIVQSYPNGAGPGWITEGIADYVRNKFGVNNEGANWKMPEYSSKQNFNNSYRITARFFVWIEKNYDKNFVKKLDEAMRTKQYKDDFCKTNTGKTFKELWAEYGNNPAI